MSLLALLTARHTTPDPTPPVGADLPAVEETPIPYAMPTAAPWNPPVPALVPTYDGSNEPTHPSVVDMVHETGEPWHGYRFWMAHTPYPDSNARLENPSVVVSNNGYDWHDAEVGIINPLVPEPTGSGYHSDADLAWNPELGRMEMVWRPMLSGEQIKLKHSQDGINWSPEVTLLDQPAGGFLSPSLVRLGANRWRMFAVSGEPRQLVYRDAPTPEGPWGGNVFPATTPGPDIMGNNKPIWHLDINSPDNDGVMRGTVVTYPLGAIHAMTSTDEGQTWRYGTTPLLTNRSGQWDSGWLYRPTMTYHENGTHARLWYPSHAASPNTRIGYTELPLSLWPS